MLRTSSEVIQRVFSHCHPLHCGSKRPRLSLYRASLMSTIESTSSPLLAIHYNHFKPWHHRQKEASSSSSYAVVSHTVLSLILIALCTMANQNELSEAVVTAPVQVVPHLINQEVMEHASIFSSIAADWQLLDEISRHARQINAKPGFDAGMDAAIILSILGKNMNLHGTTEMSLDIARVASKCVGLRVAENSLLPSGWSISLDKVYRIFYCISTEGIRQILPDAMYQDMTMAPVLASQLTQSISTYVQNFYTAEFHESIEDLDCFLVVSAIQEKFDKDESEEDEEEESNHNSEENDQGANNAAPAA